MANRYPLLILALIPLALAACNAFNGPTGAREAMPSTVLRGVNPGATTEPGSQWLLLTCADCDNGTVYYYHGDHPGQPFKSLAVNNVFAIAVDDSQDVYVSAGGRNTPTSIREEYANGGSRDFSDKVYNAASIAPLAGAAPGFYVANDRNEIFFPMPPDNRSRWVFDGNLNSVHATTVDQLGIVFLGGSTGRGGYEVDIINSAPKAVNLHLNLKGLPVGLFQDAQGNLIVDELGVGVAVFAPRQSSPVKWFDHENGSHPVSAVLNHDGTRLYVLDNASVFVYAYPGGQLLWEYSVPHRLSCCAGQIATLPRMPPFDPGPLHAANGRFRYWTDLFSTEH